MILAVRRTGSAAPGTGSPPPRWCTLSFRPSTKTLPGGNHGRLHIAGERSGATRVVGRARHAAPVHPAQRPGAERPEVRVRARPMWSLHGADRRQIRALVLGAGIGRAEGSHDHARGAWHDRE